MVALGLLVVDVEGHGGLRLGDDCRPVLRGERKIAPRRDMVRRKVAREADTKATGRTGGGSTAPQLEDGTARDRFEALRARRLALAREQGVPPYVIFHDTTLVEMASAKPRTLDQMARIHGLGTVKLERYGRIFLDIIVAFLDGNEAKRSRSASGGSE